MSTDGLLGGMWADREGYLDTTGTVHAYAKAARKRGAEYFENTKVEALEQTNNKVALAADKLKLRRTTLIEKMKKYSINVNQNIS